MLPGNHIRHHHALFGGLVGQHRATHHVADGPQARHLGRAVVIHLDEATLVGRQADGVEAEVVGVGHAANRHDQAIDFQGLGSAVLVGVADGDVVLAASLQGGVDEGVGGVGDRGGVEVASHLRGLDQIGAAVAAQHQPVALDQLDEEGVGLHGRVEADGAGDDVAVAAGARLFLGDAALLEQLVDHRVVLCELPDQPVADEVGAGVAYVHDESDTAAEALGVGEKMHEPLFEAIHIDRLNLRDEKILAELFAEHAQVSLQDFSKAFSAFAVKGKVGAARAKGGAYGITGVPTMVVNGKYRVDGSMAGSNESMLKVVDFLVFKEQAKF